MEATMDCRHSSLHQVRRLFVCKLQKRLDLNHHNCFVLRMQLVKTSWTNFEKRSDSEESIPKYDARALRPIASVWSVMQAKIPAKSTFSKHDYAWLELTNRKWWLTEKSITKWPNFLDTHGSKTQNYAIRCIYRFVPILPNIRHLKFEVGHWTKAMAQKVLFPRNFGIDSMP